MKTPPRWYGKGYGNYPTASWDEAVEQCRTVLVEWARNGHADTYGKLVEKVDAIPWPEGPWTHKGSQVGTLLGYVAVEEWLSDRPLLSALVYGKEGSQPGPGYFTIVKELGLSTGDSQTQKDAQWHAEMKKCWDHWKDK